MVIQICTDGSEASKLVTRVKLRTVIYSMQMTVIFCEPKYDQIRYIRMLLSIFETLSGLMVNWRKNSLFPIQEVPHIQDLATILGCRVDKRPTYLGMPLGSKHMPMEIWDGIVEKTEKK